MYLYCNLSRNWRWHYMGFTWGSHGSAHETAPVNPLFCHTLELHGAYIGHLMNLPMWSHCFATHWHYMGFTLIGPWNCPCKAIVCHTLALHGVYIGRLMNCPYKPLSCHTMVLHGVYSGWPMKLLMKSHCFSTHWHCMGFTSVNSWKCPYKDTVLPHIRITWFHAGQPMKLPM